MEFRVDKNNPYKVLGVPSLASIEVCKATYRALVKIYHPDIFTGDKEFAKKRMAELNAAFEFLSNVQKKAKFDRDFQEAHAEGTQEEFNQEPDREEFAKAAAEIEARWEFACGYHPELLDIYGDVSELNVNLGFVFKAAVVEGQQFTTAEELAKTIEANYLTPIFSTDQSLKDLGKFAIKKRNIVFAKELNQSLKVLGLKSKYQILGKLSSKYPEFFYEACFETSNFNLIPKNNPVINKENIEFRNIVLFFALFMGLLAFALMVAAAVLGSV